MMLLIPISILGAAAVFCAWGAWKTGEPGAWILAAIYGIGALGVIWLGRRSFASRD